jgi:tRNA U34 2-thiouridine synthase MnmA/TrmU/very-short-patch-repair endonuclease
VEKILVGLSGGVDSAVSAYLLKEQWYDVTAGFMINYMADEWEVCPTREDIEVAREVATFLDIPFFTFDYRDEYEEKVLNYMYEGYQKWITPNPDIMCNSEIKFKVFLDEALELWYDYVATGHYARIEETYSLNNTSPLAPLLPGEGNNNVVWNYYKTPEYIKELVKELRINETDTEKELWELLRWRKFYNLKFRRQHPFWRYIVDFYCDEIKLVIELDGEIHENTKEYDKIRDDIINQYGVQILRIKNQELIDDLGYVLNKILQFIPSPGRRGLGWGVVWLSSSLVNSKGLGWGVIWERTKELALKKWIDSTKDQSYFLAGLSQKQLSHSLFPIGHLEKSEVREIAEKIWLPNAKRKDSQWICFVGKVNMVDFLEKKIEHKKWLIKDIDWKVLWQHKWVFYYTIGQRKWLDVWGQKEPIFILKKDIENNEIIVWYGDNKGLFSNTLEMRHIHFLWKSDFDFPLAASAKIRYRQADQDCVVHKENNGNYRVIFTEKQRAIAAWQICAVYLENTLIISGVII